jgi:23S rRNA (adenine2503-C2)-methyltransferase
MDSLEAQPVDLLSLTRPGLEALAAERVPEAAGSAGRIYAMALRAGRFDPAALGLGEAKAEAWRRHFRMTELKPIDVIEEPGEFGATAKAVLQTEDGLSIECVRIPMATRERDDDRATICISSQVGCLMGCAFCETGLRGLTRSLNAGEIVGQVIVARHQLGWRFRNIVFMGMGEPFDNSVELFRSLEVFFDQSGLGLAQDRITICTSGHVEGLRLLAQRPWRRLNLSISLNATTDEARNALMPIGRRWPLAELRTALRDYPKRANFVLGINYCLIPGLNDSAQDVARLKEFCSGRVLVNLIPYNPGSAPIGRAPSEEEIERFIGLLLSAGIPARRRATKGRSIMAACGQLGGQAENPGTGDGD